MSPLGRFFVLTIIITATLLCALLFARWSVRRAKHRSPRFASFYWALMFYSSGRMPPPPPQTHIEQENREKKNRNFGHGDEE